MKTLLVIARRIGVPGLFRWLFIEGVYLWVREPIRDWHALAKYTAMSLGVAYLFRTAREAEERERKKPYILCAACAKKNHDPGGISDLRRWMCGYCKKAMLVRVGMP